MTTPSAALAQEAPLLTAPTARENSAVPYPSGARGDAEVVLEIVVEKDGSVSRATVLEGNEPFVEHARNAVSTWLFAPAKRGDTPIAARIRVRVEFHQDQAPVADAGAPAPSPPPVSAAPASAPPPTVAELPLEVTVPGRRGDVGRTTLSDAEVRELPGAFGDPFRAVEVLPSVTPIVSGLPYFYIRGAPPNDNGYYLDGIRVPLLFHLGIGQGVIHPGLVDHVDFFPGVAPASYGDVAGATVAGQTRGPSPIARGQASLRLVDAGGLVETPFGGGRGSVLAAGRYGYPGPILGAIASGLTLGYWDYQARSTWRLADRDSIGLFLFGSHDALATPSPSADPTARPIEAFVSDFHRADLRWDHELDDGRVRLAVTGGRDRSGVAPTHITATSASARLEAEAGFGTALRARAGASARYDAYGFQQDQIGAGEPIPIPSSASPPPTNVVAGGYADVTWKIGARVELVPGARFGAYSSSRDAANAGEPRVRTTARALDPRLSARIAITPAVASISTFGTAHQLPVLRVAEIPAALVSAPGFPVGVTRLQAALMASQGFELALPGDVVLTATGFLSRWSGLTDLTTTSCSEVGQPPVVSCPADQPVDGQAYGLEVLVRRSLSRRLGGWLSYTLSRSTRQGRFITPARDVVLANTPAEFDRTHVLNAAVTFAAGRRWRLGARSLFYTGAPYSQLEGGAPIPPYNGYRNPSFLRLDLRIEKRWALGKVGSIALVIEGQNVTLSKEMTSFGQQCMGSPGLPTQCTPTRGSIGPITIPSIGVEGFF